MAIINPSVFLQGVGKQDLENQLSDMVDVKKAAKLVDEVE